MKSISPIIGSILLIVMTVAIAGLFYAFTSGMFNSIISSSNNLVNQQSKIISFTINNVYCSNNILYFDIYNKGNIPININNSEIIFTDNNGNTISINGSNIICNNGNIINIGSNSLCYIINYSCYYNYTDYIKTTNFLYNGINYNYEILSNNKFIIYYSSTGSLMYVPSSNNYPITIYNTQSISTPSPFQQDIAICNGNPGYVSSFAYINNAILFNQINSNGSNIYFATTAGGTPNIYSWYEGQLSINNVTCDIWWIKLPNGIPANSNITIYMYIGPNSTNYYQQYYPYVGTNEQVIGTMQYDNGQDVFIAYGYFDNTFDGWSGYIYAGSFSPTATLNGIEMINDQFGEGTYILPPNNWNIPKIPLIVEEAWYFDHIGGQANAVSLFGNTNQQFNASSIQINYGGWTPAPNLSTFVETQYGVYTSYLKSAVTFQGLGSIPFNTPGTIYTYLIVNSTYAQTGYYIYNSNQVWAPLTLLDTYNINNNGYTYSNLNYNPFQYGTLEVSAGTGGDISDQYVEWVVARAYPPNGVMPSIYIS
ncbi:MAG: archaellin/type IV pilin N-terminal domain-containing protein [Candidatus Nanopusillus acidilobi]